ncbi:MAG: hypothetical protein KY462_08170 [Actinobacteria bacterium]|nr:hypothetical protein [Actinomycetota bacterium]
MIGDRRMVGRRRRRTLDGAPDHPRREDGSAAMLGWSAIAVTVVALVIAVDLAAYLVAAQRAQGAADAAALAAVAASHPRGGAPGPPEHAARSVTHAAGAVLQNCRCPPGARQVTVTVEVRVRAVAVTRLAGRKVRATAQARLVRDRNPSRGRSLVRP